MQRVFNGEVDPKGNFQFYPKQLAMADLEIISLACTMEAVSIDSENLLWFKLKKDYPGLFTRLICRTPIQPPAKAASALYCEDTGGGFQAARTSKSGYGN
jgi:hypothetical protein